MIRIASFAAAALITATIAAPAQAAFESGNGVSLNGLLGANGVSLNGLDTHNGPVLNGLLGQNGVVLNGLLGQNGVSAQGMGAAAATGALLRGLTLPGGVVVLPR